MLSLQARPSDRDRDAQVLGVLIRTNTSVSASLIAERLELPQALVLPALRRLVDAGKATEYRARYRAAECDSMLRARFRDANEDMASAVALVGRCDRILKAIAAQKGITAERLARDLKVSLDEIDHDLVLLLEREQITEHEHGYRRNGHKEMAV